jgi:hypothetical protein
MISEILVLNLSICNPPIYIYSNLSHSFATKRINQLCHLNLCLLGRHLPTTVGATVEGAIMKSESIFSLYYILSRRFAKHPLFFLSFLNYYKRHLMQPWVNADEEILLGTTMVNDMAGWAPRLCCLHGPVVLFVLNTGCIYTSL